MKKRISILLALVMLLSLCACGSSAAQTEASMDSAPMEAPRSVMASSNESASAAAAGGFAAYDDAMPVPEPEEAPAEDKSLEDNLRKLPLDELLQDIRDL